MSELTTDKKYQTVGFSARLGHAHPFAMPPETFVRVAVVDKSGRWTIAFFVLQFLEQPNLKRWDLLCAL